MNILTGEFAIIVAFATVVVTAYWPGDKPIFPVPTVCPDVDPLNYTVHLAHPDCEKFYKCVGGEKVEMSCPWMDKAQTKRLHFNRVLQVCDYPYRAGCKNDSTHIPTSTTSNGHITTHSPPPEGCSFGPVGSTTAHKTRCFKYYYCKGNQVNETRDCDVGLTYNPVSRQCDNIGLCALTGPCSNIRVPKGEHVYIPDPKSCKNAYACGEEDEIKLPCEGKSLWSATQSKCLPADQANCKEP